MTDQSHALFRSRQLIANFFDNELQPLFLDSELPIHVLAEKEGGERVGELDTAIESIASRFAERAFPGYTLVSEETPYEWPPKHPNVLLFDPLDGTHNEGAAMGTFGTMMTEFRNFEPVVTVILVPWQEAVHCNGLYSAIRGHGAWQRLRGEWKRTRVSTTKRLAESFLMLEGPTKVAEVSPAATAIRRAVQRYRVNPSLAVSFTRIAGSSRLKLPVDLCLAVGNKKPMDNLHGILMTEEAGGRVTDHRERSWSLENFSDLLFSNGLVHDEALARINS